MATARPICSHSNAGSLVQASRWRLICLERITQPEAARAALIHQLDWPLPQQPLPKIYKTTIENVWTT